MIHIVGTDHSLQYWNAAKEAAAPGELRREETVLFDKYLSLAVRELHIDLIAEEANVESGRRYEPGAVTLAKRIADRLHLQHVYCEPDSDQRKGLGVRHPVTNHEAACRLSEKTGMPFARAVMLEDREDFKVREKFWADQLLIYNPNAREVLFICGANHVDSFKSILVERQISAVVACCYTEPDQIP